MMPKTIEINVENYIFTSLMMLYQISMLIAGCFAGIYADRSAGFFSHAFYLNLSDWMTSW